VTGDGTGLLRRRLPRRERERLIVEEAVRFFAEVGFEGQTRALAQRLGVTQPLLYRYFPDKGALIERVYREVFVDQWNPDWETMLADRSRPLQDRIVAFYRAYNHMNFSYERVRLFMFAGLKDQEIGRRYLAFVHQHVFIPIARELVAEAGLPDAEAAPEVVELVAGLHGAIGYFGTRRWVFCAPVPEDADAAILRLVETFVAGAQVTLRDLGASQLVAQ
jgi:AcrR family transcriptional regulator